MAPVRSLSVVVPTLALAFARPVVVNARDASPVRILSETAESTFEVTLRQGDRVITTCTTPCSLQLPTGTYRAEAHSDERTFAVRFSVVRSAVTRVRLGTGGDRVREWTGLTLAALGLSTGAMALDHWRYAALEAAGVSTRPWVSQYVPGLNGDLAIATGVAFVPLTAFLLAPAIGLLGDTRQGVVTERVIPSARATHSEWRLASMRFELLNGGAFVATTLAF
jgi:hypothetical protein